MKTLVLGVVIIILICVIVSADSGQAEVEKVINQTDPALRTALTDYIKLLGMQRPPRAPAPRTLEEWETRREEIRKRVLESLGLSPMPPRTDLKPRITGVVDRPEYRIEKIVIESLPDFPVTLNLYLPKGAEFPAPAIFCPHGHAQDAKAAYYQNFYIGLAKKGYIVLAIDGVGFGERAHTGHRCQIAPYTSGQCILGFEIWDNVRAIDYLYTRPEVDKERLGIAGSSGGGLQTTYMIAVDDRLKCAVPVDFVTTFRAFVGTDIVHCICNHAMNVMRYADMADLLSVFAPNPLRIICGDFDRLFPVDGARQTFADVHDIYRLYGAESNVTIHVSPSGHGFDKDKREAAYAWFNESFGIEAGSHEPEIVLKEPETLYCLDGGEVSSDTETIPTLHYSRVQELNLQRQSAPTTPEALRVTIVDELFGGFPNRSPLEPSITGKAENESRFVERVLLRSEPHMRIPVLVFVPKDGGEKHPAVVHVDPQGKQAAAGSAHVTRLLELGFMVLAPDLRGYGETYDPRAAYHGESEYLWVTDSILIGRHLLGMRVYDTTRCLDYLLSREDVNHSSIGCSGDGVGGLIALFAGALDERFAWTATSGMLSSLEPDKGWLVGPTPWGNFIDERYTKPPMVVFLPNILKYADIPDIAALGAGRPLMIEHPVDGMEQTLGLEKARTLFGDVPAIITETESREAENWLRERSGG